LKTVRELDLEPATIDGKRATCDVRSVVRN
jgi:hypothetical protein